MLLAEGLIAAGEPERALAESELAVRLADERGLRVFAPTARNALAALLIERGRPGDAGRGEALLDEAEAIAHETGSESALARLAPTRVKLWELRGERERRERALSEGLELARRIDARSLQEKLEAEAGVPGG